MCSGGFRPRRRRREKGCVWIDQTEPLALLGEQNVSLKDREKKTSFYQPYMMSVQRRKGMTHRCVVYHTKCERWPHIEPAHLCCVHTSTHRGLSLPATTQAQWGNAIINRGENDDKCVKSTCLRFVFICCLVHDHTFREHTHVLRHNAKRCGESSPLQVFLRAIHHRGIGSAQAKPD